MIWWICALGLAVVLAFAMVIAIRRSMPPGTHIEKRGPNFYIVKDSE